MSANDGVARGQVIHGARMHMRINGVKVGYVQRVSMQQMKNTGDVEAIDDLLDIEHVVLGIKYTGNLTRIALIQSKLADAGILKPIEDVLATGLDNLQLIDSATGQLWHAFQKVTFSGWSADVGKGQPSVYTVNFKAIAATDGNGIHVV